MTTANTRADDDECEDTTEYKVKNHSYCLRFTAEGAARARNASEGGELLVTAPMSLSEEEEGVNAGESIFLEMPEEGIEINSTVLESKGAWLTLLLRPLS